MWNYRKQITNFQEKRNLQNCFYCIFLAPYNSYNFLICKKVTEKFKFVFFYSILLQWSNDTPNPQTSQYFWKK